jgi:hypothetical protein
LLMMVGRKNKNSRFMTLVLSLVFHGPAAGDHPGPLWDAVGNRQIEIVSMITK